MTTGTAPFLSFHRNSPHANWLHERRELLCGECDSRCGSLTGHWWNFLEFQTSYEHGHRRYSAPAVQFPTGTDEFRVWAQGEVQDQLSDATVKLLWQLEERLLRPGLPV